MFQLDFLSSLYGVSTKITYILVHIPISVRLEYLTSLLHFRPPAKPKSPRLDFLPVETLIGVSTKFIGLSTGNWTFYHDKYIILYFSDYSYINMILSSVNQILNSVKRT